MRTMVLTLLASVALALMVSIKKGNILYLYNRIHGVAREPQHDVFHLPADGFLLGRRRMALI